MNKRPQLDFKTFSTFVVLVVITLMFVFGARVVLNVPGPMHRDPVGPITAGFSDQRAPAATAAAAKELGSKQYQTGKEDNR